MPNDLVSRHCTACDPSTPRLGDAEVNELLAEVPGWERDGDAITRTFRFGNYFETMAFVNAVAFVAHREDHHPDLVVRYRECTVRYNTHAVGGLSNNDFVCAAKISALLG